MLEDVHHVTKWNIPRLYGHVRSTARRLKELR